MNYELLYNHDLYKYVLLIILVRLLFAGGELSTLC